jgi:hypothetical protein
MVKATHQYDITSQPPGDISVRTDLSVFAFFVCVLHFLCAFFAFFCIVCVFLCVEFLSVHLFLFVGDFFAFFCVHFLHFLLSGAVCVVDLTNIDNIGDNQYGEIYNIGNKQYSSKNLSYCPIHSFLESITPLTVVKPAEAA